MTSHLTIDVTSLTIVWKRVTFSCFALKWMGTWYRRYLQLNLAYNFALYSLMTKVDENKKNRSKQRVKALSRTINILRMPASLCELKFCRQEFPILMSAIMRRVVERGLVRWKFSNAVQSRKSSTHSCKMNQVLEKLMRFILCTLNGNFVTQY